MRSFQAALESGHRAERAWVDSLRSLGRSVGHGKKIVVSKHCKQTGHVETPDAVALFSLEIKERNLTFTCPNDYPYDTVFVDDLRGMGKENYLNLFYVYMSKPTGQWVWLTMLDRDERWKEEVTHDRGRGHDVPVLVAPKACLRPAEQLTSLIYPHLYLDLVDGDTGWLCSGGGETEARERYVNATHPDAAGRADPPASKTRKHLG